MITALLAAMQVAAPSSDSIPTVTLDEALSMAQRVSPEYVAAEGQVGDAAWSRRAAFSAIFLPRINATTTATGSTNELFNLGTGQLTDRVVEARLEASYDLFAGGRKFYELGRSKAELERAQATAVEARFNAEFLTESAYYDVLAQKELQRVAEERVARAEEQFAVARARVLSGAAVQTDSLQLLLELTRARVDGLRQAAAVRVSRLELGRRVGIHGPVDAAPLGPLPEGGLPISEAEAVAEALSEGPAYGIAVAEEEEADAAFKSARSAYLPQVSLFGQWTGFDEGFFPNATTRTLYGFTVTLPIWNNAQRELGLARASTRRTVARATRRDRELEIRRDVVEAYQNYRTARASTDLAERAVLVARESLRVQETRYRAGATTILDLLTAQLDLVEAEAELVQARQSTRLALADLEALLGRRLLTQGR